MVVPLANSVKIQRPRYGTNARDFSSPDIKQPTLPSVCFLVVSWTFLVEDQEGIITFEHHSRRKQREVGGIELAERGWIAERTTNRSFRSDNLPIQTAAVKAGNSRSTMQPAKHLRKYRRHLDEVDYWRAQAGWVDDAMDPDAISTSSASSSNQQGTNNSFGNTPDEVVKNVLKLLSIVVALFLSVLFFRAIMRRMNSEKEKKRPSEKSRSGSSRRSRSHSRSRKGEYDLMKDDGDEKSKRSTRSRSSRSRSRRSRSRSRTERSRSKSKTRVVEKTTEPQPVQEAVLV
eukprot:scaffold54_cov158-Amphora_coffeaeformis.AAC.6